MPTPDRPAATPWPPRRRCSSRRADCCRGRCGTGAGQHAFASEAHAAASHQVRQRRHGQLVVGVPPASAALVHRAGMLLARTDARRRAGARLHHALRGSRARAPGRRWPRRRAGCGDAFAWGRSRRPRPRMRTPVTHLFLADDQAEELRPAPSRRRAGSLRSRSAFRTRPSPRSGYQRLIPPCCRCTNGRHDHVPGALGRFVGEQRIRTRPRRHRRPPSARAPLERQRLLPSSRSRRPVRVKVFHAGQPRR